MWPVRDKWPSLEGDLCLRNFAQQNAFEMPSKWAESSERRVFEERESVVGSDFPFSVLTKNSFPLEFFRFSIDIWNNLEKINSTQIFFRPMALLCNAYTFLIGWFDLAGRCLPCCTLLRQVRVSAWWGPVMSLTRGFCTANSLYYLN